MNQIILKKKTEAHFTKDFGGGTTSDRLILPEPDGCRVKVTMFRPKAGFSAQDIVYACDETVHAVSGRTRLHLAGSADVVLEPGETYHVPGGTAYGLTALTDGALFCVFSPASDGSLPDNG